MGSWGATGEGGAAHVTSEGTPADINRRPAKAAQHSPQSSAADCAHLCQDARRHTACLLPRPAGLHLRLLLPELPKGRQEGHVRPGAETGRCFGPRVWRGRGLGILLRTRAARSAHAPRRELRDRARMPGGRQLPSTRPGQRPEQRDPAGRAERGLAAAAGTTGGGAGAR
eukprot:bmy_07665T0